MWNEGTPNFYSLSGEDIDDCLLRKSFKFGMLLMGILDLLEKHRFVNIEAILNIRLIKLICELFMAIEAKYSKFVQ